MNYISKVFVLFSPFLVVSGQDGNCDKEGSQLQCQSIFKCQPLLSLVNKSKKTEQDKGLLKNSHCGIDDDEPAVCCPVYNELRPCVTPEGNPGQCMNFFACKQIRRLADGPLRNEVAEYIRKSRCKEEDFYSVCCGPVPNFEWAINDTCQLTAFPPDPKTGCCGIESSIKNKILGGTETAIDQYPWLARHEYMKNGTKQVVNSCGVLISANYVVSTATAVTNEEKLGKLTTIVLGEYDTANDGPDCAAVEGGGVDCSDGAIGIEVASAIAHPQYDKVARINDISIIRLQQNAPYTDFIRPICLPTFDLSTKKRKFYMTAAGWGSTINMSKTNIKNHVALPYVKQEDCQKAYSKPGRMIKIVRTHICAGGEKNKDTCKGDGPLMYKDGNTYLFAGILSFGAIPCGTEGVPTVYTNIYEYISWIRENVVP